MAGDRERTAPPDEAELHSHKAAHGSDRAPFGAGDVESDLRVAEGVSKSAGWHCEGEGSRVADGCDVCLSGFVLAFSPPIRFSITRRSIARSPTTTTWT